jgi:hypothetical protein
MLVQSVCAHADELECCRIAEQQLRDEMCDAVRAAEADAHKKAEDAYQEASYAGVMPRLLVMTLHVSCASAVASLQLMLEAGPVPVHPQNVPLCAVTILQQQPG